MVIGIDEVGRGCWAGPLVVGTVALGEDAGLVGLADSKKLSANQREQIAAQIKSKALDYALGWVNAGEIDAYGLTFSVGLAMRRALHDLKPGPYTEIIIDGNYNFLSLQPPPNPNPNSNPKPPSSYRSRSDLPQPTHIDPCNTRCKIVCERSDLTHLGGGGFGVRTVVGGDGVVDSVSAASILAKVARDDYMKKISAKFPAYGFDKHVGYGTKLHRGNLAKHGVCTIHRRSYKPVMDLIQ